MNRFKQKLQTHTREAGVAMLELALVLPIVVTVLIATLEFTQLESRHDELSFFSQVVGQRAFMDCLTVSRNRIEAVTECLTVKISHNIRQDIAAHFPNSQVVVSIYDYDAATNSAILSGYRVITNDEPACDDGVDNDGDGGIDATTDADCQHKFLDLENPNDLRPSHYDQARVMTDFGPLIQDAGSLVIAEAILPQTTLIPGLSAFTSANWSSLYAVSIF